MWDSEFNSQVKGQRPLYGVWSCNPSDKGEGPIIKQLLEKKGIISDNTSDQTCLTTLQGSII